MKPIKFTLLIFACLLTGCMKKSVVIKGTEEQHEKILDTVNIKYDSSHEIHVRVSSSIYKIREIEPALEATLFDTKRDRFFRLVLDKDFRSIDGRWPDPYPEKNDVQMSFCYRMLRPQDDFYSSEEPEWIKNPSSNKPLNGLPLKEGKYTLSFGISPKGHERRLVKVNFKLHEIPYNIGTWN